MPCPPPASSAPARPPISNPPIGTAPGLARGNFRRELRAAHDTADQIGADIRAPDGEEQKHRVEQAVIGLQAQPEQRDAADPGIGNAGSPEPADGKVSDTGHHQHSQQPRQPAAPHLAYPDRQQQAGQQEGLVDTGKPCPFGSQGQAGQRPPTAPRRARHARRRTARCGPGSTQSRAEPRNPTSAR